LDPHFPLKTHTEKQLQQRSRNKIRKGSQNTSNGCQIPDVVAPMLTPETYNACHRSPRPMIYLNWTLRWLEIPLDEIQYLTWSDTLGFVVAAFLLIYSATFLTSEVTNQDTIVTWFVLHIPTHNNILIEIWHFKSLGSHGVADSHSQILRWVKS